MAFNKQPAKPVMECYKESSFIYQQKRSKALEDADRIPVACVSC